jgi:hypothetical protein
MTPLRLSYSDTALAIVVIAAFLIFVICVAGFSYVGNQYEQLQDDFCEVLAFSVLRDLETGDAVTVREIVANSDSECFK